MRIAVAGGSGLVGRTLVAALEDSGHETVVLCRSSGTDLVTGEGLDDALSEVDVVIDVTNRSTRDRAKAVAFFEAVTRRLLSLEEAAGVGHHVVLSVVGIDRIEGNAHYAGKRRQEELAEAAAVPSTIVRATQFHEFAGMVASWAARDGQAKVPPLLVQPVAIADVVGLLVEVAAGRAGQGRIEIAGPRTEDLVDMARRTLEARGESLELIPTWRGLFDTEAAGEVLLPGDSARIGSITFDQWLASQARG
jgi:uncharacterized protein YbjT (DUF2867 family)